MNASNKEKNNIEKNCWNMFDVPVCSPFKYYNLFKAFNMMPASKSAVTISNDELHGTKYLKQQKYFWLSRQL